MTPGEVREHPIAVGEVHPYRVVVEPGGSLLVRVEQQSIGLVLAVQGPGGVVEIGAGNDRWGPVIAVLDRAGSYRLEVRSREASAWAGRYAIRVESLPGSAATPEERARRGALDLMSRAGREAFEPTPKARTRAIASYREALAAWQRLGDRTWEAETRVCLGALEETAGDLSAATADFQAALELWRGLGEAHREAEATAWRGRLAIKEDPAKAKAALESARDAWERIGEPLEAAEVRFNLCSLQHRNGSLSAALDCFTANRELFHSLGDDSHDTFILNHVGGIHDSLGEPDQALAAFEQVLAICRREGDRHTEVETLNSIGRVERTLGDWQEALHRYEEARKALVSVGDRALEATVINNIGYTYSDAGLPERALTYFEKALELHREAGDRRAEITTRNNLGMVLRRVGEPKKALAEHRRALALALALDQANVGQQATSRLRLTEDYLAMGDPAAALREAEAALEQLAQKGDRRTETEILHQRGRALLLTGQAEKALPVFREVLAKRRTARDRAGEAETLAALAEAERALGDPAGARADAEAAVARIEELRGGLPNPDLRAAFLARRREAFSLLIDLLLGSGGPAPSPGDVREAFAVSERAHARSLFDALVRAGAVRTANAGTAELLARRRSLLERLSKKGDARWKLAGEKAEAAEREIDAMETEILGVEAEIRQKDPRFAPADDFHPVAPEEVSRWLDPGTALLEYSLGEKRSFLWVVDSRGLRSFLLPGERKIETLARRVYGDLRSAGPRSEAGQKAAFTLARILLGPIWREAAPLHRLVVVPDGALHALPFAALPVPPPGHGWGSPEAAEPLLLRLEVDYAPSASALAVERQLADRPPASKWAAVFADPLFSPNDPRLARGGPGPGGRKGMATDTARRGGRTRRTPAPLVRLPATRREAEAIQSLAPPGKVWVRLGADARRETVVSGALRDYRFLHFATHALADAETPELSGLVLSAVDREGQPRNGFLGLSDLYELDLHADLVVLSGCETALGKEVRGEGLMSLTRAFQFAGVPRVVASLWQVEDRTTAELMTRFYRELWRNHLPAAAALRAAQVSLYRDPRYRSAHAWAAFELQGDWK